MPDFSAEKSLLFFIILNAAVFGAAWRFAARRITSSRSQALLDAALLGYAIQYVSIGLPGLVGCLNVASVTSVAMVCVMGLLIGSWKTRPAVRPIIPTRDRLIVGGTALFTVTFVLAFALKQADLPPISNDAITYHFPAAVQWLQQGKIGLFQTWFFNPSNTYSPLAGSIFILWLILPFGADLLARFVEVPALVCVGFAIYRLCRELGTRAAVAVLVTAAAVLCRPIFLPCMMAKDDLFVAFFLVAALVALSKHRADERWGAVRFGMALGLLLATKYTALLCVPILLFALDGPRWPVKKWMIAGGTALLLAGPWYLRNWITTGNLLFPLGSLFTSVRSDQFHSVAGVCNAVLEGPYGMPLWIAVSAGIAWILSISRVPLGRGRLGSPGRSETSGIPRPKGTRLLKTDRANIPLLRACSIGSAVAIAIFFCRSPFPEVRFLLPVFSLLFACIAFSIERFCRQERLAIIAGLCIAVLSLGTLFPGLFVAVAIPFAVAGMIVAAVGLGGMGWAGSHHLRKILFASIVVTVVFVFTYINWASFCAYQRQTRFVDGAGYWVEYPQMTGLWNFVDQNIPADATVAYTNLYFVYPLQGGALRRRLIYAPTRKGVESVADLGWLGKNLSGERLVRAAIAATVASPDKTVWLSNLEKSGAKYLVIGRNGMIDTPMESRFASADPKEFTLLFQGASGWVYQFHPALPG